TEVKVAVHALVGGLISRAMGGEFVAGAAGAGAATLAMETFGKELESSDALRKLSEKDRNALMQLVSGAIGGLVAGAVSGSGSAAAAGGATSQMAEQFNREQHEHKNPEKDEKTTLARLQEGKSSEEQQRLADAACALIHCAAGLSDNDPDKAALEASERRGAQNLVQQGQLKATGLFAYSWGDAGSDVRSRELDWIKHLLIKANQGLDDASASVSRGMQNSGNPGSHVTPSDLDNLTGGSGGGGGPSGPARAVVTPGVTMCIPGVLCPTVNVAPGAPSSGLPSNAIASSGGDDSTTTGSKSNDSNATKRPTPRNSETDVGSDLGSDYRPQVSYKDGKEVPYGTKGSVRPDWCNTTSCSVEVKNYNIDSNSSGLIKNVAEQAIQRQANLPAGMDQQVVIDIRGQKVTDAQKISIIKGIVKQSNGIIGPTSIRFKQ
ncbi:hemagglutinin repeat-containing protein, partial [Ralstonia pseudosolanacearum]